MDRKQRSRGQILDAAISEFELYGIENVSMDSLAKAAGLTRATVYNLFASKEAVAQAIVQQKVALWSAAFAPKIKADENGLELLKSALVENSKMCSKYPNIALNVLTKPQDSALADGDEDLSFRHLILKLIELCQLQGIIRRDLKPTFIMLLVLGPYIQLMMLLLNTGGGIAEPQITLILETLFDGIGAGSNTDEVAL